MTDDEREKAIAEAFAAAVSGTGHGESDGVTVDVVEPPTTIRIPVLIPWEECRQVALDWSALTQEDIDVDSVRQVGDLVQRLVRQWVDEGAEALAFNASRIVEETE